MEMRPSHTYGPVRNPQRPVPSITPHTGHMLCEPVWESNPIFNSILLSSTLNKHTHKTPYKTVISPVSKVNVFQQGKKKSAEGGRPSTDSVGLWGELDF